MNLRPSKNYFLIRISRPEQKKRKEKIGSILLAQTQTFMTRNIQHGEILGIGQKAHEYFPEANVGDTLLIHHLIEDESEYEAKNKHLIYQDEEFNYYVVAAFEHNGRGHETYGVWNGSQLIPCKDYIFLDAEAPCANDLPPDEFINQSLEESQGGLFLFKEWRASREQVTAKMNIIKQEIHNISKGKNSHTVSHEILRKEEEMSALSAQINKQTYEPYRISAINPETSQWFNENISIGDIIYALNIASQTIVEFMGKDYRMVQVKYIGFLLNKNVA